MRLRFKSDKSNQCAVYGTEKYVCKNLHIIKHQVLRSKIGIFLFDLFLTI